ncbi:MAG: outer membrane lipoprotein carrier protein LolA [Balneolaceae bacterium]
MVLRIYNKKIVSLLFVLFLFSTQMLAQHPAFDQLKTRFQEGMVFSAGFSHTYYDSYTGETATSNGKIWIGEQSYKLKSDDQELVVDGLTSKVYDEKRNRLIISDYSEDDDDFAPSRMLQGVDSTYTVSEKQAGKGNTTIVLETEDDFALFVRVEIVIDSNINPISIVAYDFSENVITTRFQNGKFLNNKGQLFLLKYPKDAEIVDTRY